MSTGAGTRPDITLKLSQLQNLCKRDPDGYRTDYDAQILRLQSECDILSLSPSARPPPHLAELIQFAAAVSSSSYKERCEDVANLLVRLLLGQSTKDGEGGSCSGGITPHTKDLHKSFTLTLPTSALALHKDVRKSCVSALILMRNKGKLPPLRLLQLFFRIMSVVPDKGLREQLYKHIVNDIRNINAKGKRDEMVNRRVQGFLHKIVSYTVPTDNTSHHDDANRLLTPTGSINGNDTNEARSDATTLAARRAILLTRELYRRRVWTDARTVSILATGSQSSLSKVASSSMRFFLGIEDKMAEDERREEEDIWNGVQDVNLHSHSTKTKKRMRGVEKQLKRRLREQKRRETEQEMEMVDQGVEGGKKLYPAIQLLVDPHGLAESVLRRLMKTGAMGYKVFEVKVLAMNFVTRLVGNHELMLLPLYPFLRRYMGGHQRDVTSVLAYAVQACHNAVPSEEVHGLLKTIAHNFVTERCSGEQMAVGINACRAICARVSSALVVDEEEDAGTTTSPSSKDTDKDTDGSYSGTATNVAVVMDIEAFVRDLASYSKHRDRSVAVAGRAWQNMIRDLYPSLLAGKDRGRTGAALHKEGVKPLRYGAQDVATGVAGADLLVEYESKKAAYLKRKERMRAMGQEDDDSSSSDEDGGNRFEKMNDGWVDVEAEGKDEDEEGDGVIVEMEEEKEDGNADITSQTSDDEITPNLLLVKEVDDKMVHTTDNTSDSLQLPTASGNDNDDDDDDNNDDDEQPLDLSKMTCEERTKLRLHVSSTRVFTTFELKKMAKLVERQHRARRDPRVAARTKRRLAQGKVDFEELSDDSDDWDSDSDDEVLYVKGAVRNYDIMASARKKRQNKVERLEKILTGREKFEFKARVGGSTNTEKKRKKSFLMTKFSFENRTKQGSKETARRGTLKKNKKSRVKEGSNQKRRRRT